MGVWKWVFSARGHKLFLAQGPEHKHFFSTRAEGPRAEKMLCSGTRAKNNLCPRAEKTHFHTPTPCLKNIHISLSIKFHYLKFILFLKSQTKITFILNFLLWFHEIFREIARYFLGVWKYMFMSPRINNLAISRVFCENPKLHRNFGIGQLLISLYVNRNFVHLEKYCRKITILE